MTGKVSKVAQRSAIAAMFFLHGLCFPSWASRIPQIQQKLNLSDTKLGLILFSMPLGLILSMPISGWLSARIGSHKIVIFGIASYAIILTLLGYSTSINQIGIFLFLYGVASNLVNISVNTLAVDVEALYGRSIMASFHGLWSLAGFVGALIGTLMNGNNINPFIHFTMVTISILIGIGLCLPFITKKERSSKKAPLLVLPGKSLIILGIVVFCSMVCEGAMFDWGGVYFRKVVKAEHSWVGAGFTAFMCSMALGRFFADKFKTHFGLKRTLQISGVLIATGLLISIIYPTLVIATLAFLMIGFGISSVVPLIYSKAGKSEKVVPEIAIAAVSTLGFIGFMVGPPLIGLISGYYGLKSSFALVSVFGLTITIFSFLIKEAKITPK